MRNKTFLLLSVLFAILTSANAQTKWYNPLDGDEPYVCGRAWNQEIGKSFNRMPERMQSVMPKYVWEHAQESSGLSVRFNTTSNYITVKYQLLHGTGGYPNLTMLAHSGVDLYAMDVDGNKHWIGSHMNWKMENGSMEFTFFNINTVSFTRRGLQFELYLPNYNGVKNLLIGVDNKASFEFIHQSKERPIVVYGTSIIQGASPSRPGLSITNIVERELDYPIINLGFSGSALMEPALFDAISEIDARAYIIDPMPNSYRLSKEEIVNRATEGVKKIRSKSEAPILLVESCPSVDSVFHRNIYKQYATADSYLRQAYEQLKADGVQKLFYLSHSELGLTEESMIEGVHPNDTGCRQYADAYEKKIREMLPEDQINPRYSPIMQRRDGLYEWMDRHNEVIELNHTTNPEILMIGNSITHFWGGNPKSHCNGGKEWDKFFGKRRVVNMGFGWDRIENVYWRIFHGELEGCHPKHICLLIGINNVSAGNTLENIAKGVSELATLIRARQPQAKLHIIKVYPARGREKQVARLNEMISNEVHLDSQTDLVDLTPLLTLKDGSGNIDPSCFIQDGLHPNEKGYHQIGKGLKKYLK